jgi:membrane protein YqaA with SNARE-associated domain
MGGIFNPLGVALAAGSGSAIGELSGYLAGYSGQIVLENVRIYQRIVSWMTDHRPLAFLMIFILAAVPNPFFDLAGIAAGALRFPIGHFLLWVWLGKLVKMLLFAYAGYYSLGWLSAH